MAKKAPFKQRFTVAMQRRRAESLVNGRDRNAAYTSGAQEVNSFKDSSGKTISQKEGMRQAWQNKENVQTYTSTKSGKLSVDGKKAGGLTHSFTMKDDEGNVIKQSGRGKLATRRQRDYDIRAGIRKWELENGRRFGTLPGEPGSELRGSGGSGGGGGLALATG